MSSFSPLLIKHFEEAGINKNHLHKFFDGMIKYHGENIVHQLIAFSDYWLYNLDTLKNIVSDPFLSPANGMYGFWSGWVKIGRPTC
jgi:hypothetical protein